MVIFWVEKTRRRNECTEKTDIAMPKWHWKWLKSHMSHEINQFQSWQEQSLEVGVELTKNEITVNHSTATNKQWTPFFPHAPVTWNQCQWHSLNIASQAYAIQKNRLHFVIGIGKYQIQSPISPRGMWLIWCIGSWLQAIYNLSKLVTKYCCQWLLQADNSSAMGKIDCVINCSAWYNLPTRT